jgi:hypothetical protein
MFTVKWVFRGRENEPIEIEKFGVRSQDTLLAACRYRMAMMRLKYAETPPDGFIVLDSAGKEVGRWFDFSAPS